MVHGHARKFPDFILLVLKFFFVITMLTAYIVDSIDIILFSPASSVQMTRGSTKLFQHGDVLTAQVHNSQNCI